MPGTRPWTRASRRTPAATRRRVRAGIAALALGQLLVGFDGAVATVAMPSMARDLGLDAAGVQWTMLAYLIAVAGLAVPMGALGDRLGRRRLYLAGVLVFGLASTGCALSGSAGGLVAWRAVAGAAAAAMTVLALAMLTARSADRDLPRVVGLWTALTSAALVLAPMLGGIAVETLGWRGMFAVNLPIALVIGAVLAGTGSSLGRDARTEPAVRVDLVGALLLLAATVLVVAGVTTLAQDSAGPLPWLLLLTGLAALAGLVLEQRRTARPLTDWTLLGRAPVPWLLALRALVALALTGSMFQQNLLLQNAFDYSPAVAGALDIAPAVVFMLLAARTSWLLRSWGLRACVLLGLASAALGTAGTALIDEDDPSIPALAALSVLLGLGLGLVVPTLSARTMERFPAAARGAASGFLSLAAQLSAVLGIAVLGAIAAGATRMDWVDHVRDRLASGGAAADVVVGAITAVHDAYGLSAALHAAAAYGFGVRASLWSAALLLLLGFVAVLLLPRSLLEGSGAGAGDVVASD